MTIQPIEQAAAKYPEQLAYDDGVVRATYSELMDELSTANDGSGLGLRLASLPVGQHVAWSPENDFLAFKMFWAIQRQACVACPVSHRLPAAVRKQVVARLDACWLDSEFQLVAAEVSGSGRDCPQDNVLNRPATIILSSGSTGVPKAVVHSMAAHVASAEGAAKNMPLLPSDRWLWSLPLFHVSGLSVLIRCAVAGATVVGLPSDTPLSAELLAERRITHLSVVNTQLRRLLQQGNFPSVHLKAILLGGSSVDESLVRLARQRGIAVHTTYGLTETASQVTTSTADGDPAKSGAVLEGRELRVAADDEIYVRGQTLCLGYFVDSEIRPVVDGQGWFRTGDLGRLDDDRQLTVFGRSDNMFVSGGENIYPENIERAFLKAFGVEQVIVVPRVSQEYGARPVAFVAGDLPADWQATLRQVLQGYEVPVEVLAWPRDVELGIKPNRKRMKQLV